MGKLRFYYGCMNSLKSGTLLTKVYQFEQCGCNAILLKPTRDTRDEGVIKSRAIIGERECTTFKHEEDVYILIKSLLKENSKNVVFVDEVSFANPSQVYHLWKASKELNVDVFCYGLKTNYMNELFEASKELLILADTIEEIKSMCSYCHSKATTHLYFVDDKLVFQGEVYAVGDIENVKSKKHYKSVCQECWHKHKFEFEKGEK